MNNFRPICGDGNDPAVIISLPGNFDLQRELLRAQEVCLATAFAKMSGWRHIERGILRGNAEVRLLAGLDFMQTQPQLLRAWFKLTKSCNRVKASIAVRDSVFHPKVLIVRRGASRPDFAIVGSGNLTHGGFVTNTECGLFTTETSSVDALKKWFDLRWSDGTELKEDAIKAYEPSYKKARQVGDKIRKKQKLVQKIILKKDKAELEEKAAVVRHIAKAIKAFKKYRQTPKFKKDYSNRVKAAASIRSLLNIPQFNFDRTAFNAFYAIGYLGSLRNSYRDGIFESTRLRKTLLYLIDESVPIEKRMEAILAKNGSHHIQGFGIGGVTKILVSAYPDKWPVLNGAVNTALKFFGYEAPRGIGIGGRYLQFAKSMASFKNDANAPDFISLDAFFKSFEKVLKAR